MSATSEKRPCSRCGVPMFWKLNNQTTGLCRDCRSTDRWYVGQVLPQLVADIAIVRARADWVKARQVETDNRRSRLKRRAS